MFKFNPDPIDDLSGSKLKEGQASFKIIDATDLDKYGHPLKSKAGNNMLKVTFQVRDCEGNRGIMNDYFISNQAWKINKLLKAVSKNHWYNSGMIAPSELKNLSGECVLKSDPTPEYPDNIKISSYIEIEKTEAAEDSRSQDLRSELDDIPF